MAGRQKPPHPLPPSLGIHKLDNIFPTIINFIHYLEWFSSPLRREMRAKRLEKLSHCFPLQNLGKGLHRQNGLHLRGSSRSSPQHNGWELGKACRVVPWTPWFGGSWKEKTRESCFGHNCIIILRLLSNITCQAKRSHTSELIGNLLHSLSICPIFPSW